MTVQPTQRLAAERKLRVLVVDDHDGVHWGFRVLLGEQPWVERCLAARTGDEALALLPTLRPDVALVDLFLAGESGADVHGGQVTVVGQRLYSLVALPTDEAQTITIDVPPGVSAYDFTFG